jgi:DNA-binding NtrC family response regulator
MAELLMEDQRVLVIEDEYVVAEAIERTLKRAGATVLGPVPSVDQAMALLDRGGRIDSAVLDINLGEQKVYPVVDRLLARGVRCVFATGNDIADVPSNYKEIARLEKPVEASSIIDALTKIDTTPSGAVANTYQHTSLLDLREQLIVQIDVADGVHEPLLAARLYEAVDAIDQFLNG